MYLINVIKNVFIYREAYVYIYREAYVFIYREACISIYREACVSIYMEAGISIYSPKSSVNHQYLSEPTHISRKQCKEGNTHFRCNTISRKLHMIRDNYKKM
jgi:hypothetical protein